MVNSRSDENILLAIKGGRSLLIAHVDFAKNLFSVVGDDSRRNVSLDSIHMHRMPFLVRVEAGRLRECTPLVVESTNMVGKVEEDLDRSDVRLVLVSSPAKVGSNLAILVPDTTHDRLSLLIPQSDVLIGIVPRQRVQRLIESLDLLLQGPRISSSEIGPAVESDTRHRLGRKFDTGGARTSRRSSFQLPDDDQHVAQFTASLLKDFSIAGETSNLRLVVNIAEESSLGATSPQDGETVPTTDSFSGHLGVVEPFGILDPIVPETEIIVISLVLKDLDVSFQLLLGAKFSLVVGERALDNSSVVPGTTMDWLSVLVPKNLCFGRKNNIP